MKIGFFAGSFDPFTIGHLHIVRSASQVFDKVIIGIGVNSSKTRKYSADDMKSAILATLAEECISNVEVVVYNNLTADKALECGANYLIRGLRDTADYSYEEGMARTNLEIGGIDTIYFRSGKYSSINSKLIKELISLNKDVSKFVPAPVFELIK